MMFEVYRTIPWQNVYILYCLSEHCLEEFMDFYKKSTKIVSSGPKPLHHEYMNDDGPRPDL